MYFINQVLSRLAASVLYCPEGCLVVNVEVDGEVDFQLVNYKVKSQYNSGKFSLEDCVEVSGSKLVS